MFKYLKRKLGIDSLQSQLNGLEYTDLITMESHMGNLYVAMRSGKIYKIYFDQVSEQEVVQLVTQLNRF